MVQDSPHSNPVPSAVPARATAQHVAVIGGGVIGLSAAWKLAQSGAAVTLFDTGHRQMGGSWAAAGMLAAAVESRAVSEPLSRFNQWNASLWADFAREVSDVAEASIGHDTSGTLLLHQPGVSGHVPENTPVWGRDRLTLEEPHIGADCAGAYFFPEDHSVDSRALLSALAIACKQAGVTFRDEPITRIETAGDRVTGVVSGGELLRVDAACLAAGAWSSDILEASALAPLPVRPIKGQMLCLQTDARAPLLRHVIWGNGVYLVPRADGRLVIGATMEETGFDASLTTEAIAGLRLKAEQVVPGLKKLPVVETWAGLRAGSPDESPFIGHHGVSNLVVATGHHRNGILQAPGTAQIVTSLLQGREMPEIAHLFSPARISPRAVTITA